MFSPQNPILANSLNRWRLVAQWLGRRPATRIHIRCTTPTCRDCTSVWEKIKKHRLNLFRMICKGPSSLLEVKQRSTVFIGKKQKSAIVSYLAHNEGMTGSRSWNGSTAQFGQSIRLVGRGAKGDDGYCVVGRGGRGITGLRRTTSCSVLHHNSRLRIQQALRKTRLKFK